MSSLQAVNANIDTILQEYEQLTGNVLIKDSSLAANAPIDLCAKTGVISKELEVITSSAAQCIPRLG